MDQMQYSIIYAVIRSEISERVSVGLVTINGSEIDIRYSEDKLKALKYLYPKSQYEFIVKAVRQMPVNDSIKSKKDIDYLTRYSNNLISLSPLETIDLEPSEPNKAWLFQNYVSS